MPVTSHRTAAERAAAYRVIATDARTKAKSLLDGNARKMMAEAADTWDRLAAHLERSIAPPRREE
jgi:hypothetical protein